MFSRFLLFFGAAGAGLCAAETGRRRALRGGDQPARIWCTIPRNDVLPVNRTMKKYKICVTIILNFLLVIF